jgi:type II secretory pathway pseudopilin PulG
MQLEHARGHAGFSLIETLIAAAILITTLASLAQLVAWSVQRTREADTRSCALVAAESKLEELRARQWTFDLSGMPVSDTALMPSPGGSLDANTSGYVDFVDAAGRIMNGNGGVIVRRWAVTPIDSGTVDSIALTVCAFRAPAAVARGGAELCLSTARVRQP